jgi:hypothetical protein
MVSDELAQEQVGVRKPLRRAITPEPREYHVGPEVGALRIESSQVLRLQHDQG